MSDAAEQVFLEGEGIKVTNSRIVVGNQTYATSAVNSVSHESDIPHWLPSVALMAVGLFPAGCGAIGVLMSAGDSANSGPGCSVVMLAVGGILLALGIFLFARRKPTYYVVLTTSSGQIRALSSKDHEVTGRLSKAINEAIIARG